MKKLLFLLAVLVVPFMIVAQPMDTLTTYFEDFDTAPYKVTISTSINPPAPDWTPSTTLYRSSPQSIHSPVDVNGNITSIFTDTIRVRRDLNHTYVYLMFDQICKVNNLDEAYIDYRISTGTTPSGTLLGRHGHRFNLLLLPLFIMEVLPMLLVENLPIKHTPYGIVPTCQLLRLKHGGNTNYLISVSLLWELPILIFKLDSE
jgi:hypothetical protein